MKKILYFFIAAQILVFANLSASSLTSSASIISNNDIGVFELLDLSLDGLENVNRFYTEGKYDLAKEALLDYYKNRTSPVNPDINLTRIRINADEQKMADEGLEHKFFAHYGYQPSYFYGDDIDWDYWPVKDNELRWQLHRHKWWAPMGKAYRISNNEVYAQEWTKQYTDWIEKNPLSNSEKYKENNSFSWRPLEVSHRLQDQINQFQYFVVSPSFDADFLELFLINYRKHANHIINNFSERGNHLLFEAQRLFYAGAFFPEFKDAQMWREKGAEILNHEIGVQVYDDGFQYELDAGYHVASINIFLKAYNMAKINGYLSIFPRSYMNTLEDMIAATMNVTFPNYTMPCFSDAKLTNKNQMLRNFKDWSNIFPNNELLKHMASDNAEKNDNHILSKALESSGFFTFRNGWSPKSTMMVVKAGPPAFWHNQPDNGTFELYINGRNFFPDAGSYIYGGDESVLKEREKFRQTNAHNTLTLNNENLETTNSKTLLWDISNSSVQKFVTENQSYENLKHRRSIFFVDNSFFVIVDQAIGEAEGLISQNFHLSEGDVVFDVKSNSVHTKYGDSNNVMIQTFNTDKMDLVEKESWVSYAYRQKSKRPGFSFDTHKNKSQDIAYVTIIHPFKKKSPKVKLIDSKQGDGFVNVKFKVKSKQYELQANW